MIIISNLLTSSTILHKINQLLGFEANDILLDSVWSFMNSYFGFELDSKDRYEETDGTDDDIIFVKCKPITAIKKVLINNTEVDLTDLEIYGNRAIKYLNGYFIGTGEVPIGNYMGDYLINKISLSYTAGFTESSLPSDLIYAAALLYKSLATNVSDKGQLSSYKIDTIAYSFRDNSIISNNISNILDRYL